ncbi:MAG: 1-acyl-sn-glycerol-3-phosphate acyltransferase [Kiritimatiellia bacterium]|jgi:1-acyl-sn-glycerol-3-phosphate acyltransferase
MNSTSRHRFFRTSQGEVPHNWGHDPADFEPERIDQVMPTLRQIFGPGRYFDVHVDGFDNLPEAPALLVSNHSGGTIIPDVWGLMFAWYEHFGHERPLHALAHDMVFKLPPVARFFARGGVLRASRDQARRVLTDSQRDLLVMPGGERDTWRTWNQRYKVHFAGRKGYARTALECGVPIVPIANSGAHQTLIVLADGHRLARKLGLQKIARAEVWPVHLSLPWGLGVGPLPHFPTPTYLRYRIGAPILPPIPVEPGTTPSQAAIDAYDQVVRDSMQELLDQLRRDRPRLDERIRRRVTGIRDRLRHSESH